jgi:hypothetical protein
LKMLCTVRTIHLTMRLHSSEHGVSGIDALSLDPLR